MITVLLTTDNCVHRVSLAHKYMLRDAGSIHAHGI